MKESRQNWCWKFTPSSTNNFFIVGWPKGHQHRFSANVSVSLPNQTSSRQMLPPKSPIIYVPPEFVSFSWIHSSIPTTTEVKIRPFYSTAMLLIIAPLDWPCLIVPRHLQLELYIKSSFRSSNINQPALCKANHKKTQTHLQTFCYSWYSL